MEALGPHDVAQVDPRPRPVSGVADHIPYHGDYGARHLCSCCGGNFYLAEKCDFRARNKQENVRTPRKKEWRECVRTQSQFFVPRLLYTVRTLDQLVISRPAQ